MRPVGFVVCCPKTETCSRLRAALWSSRTRESSRMAASSWPLPINQSASPADTPSRLPSARSGVSVVSAGQTARRHCSRQGGLASGEHPLSLIPSDWGICPFVKCGKLGELAYGSACEQSTAGAVMRSASSAVAGRWTQSRRRSAMRCTGDSRRRLSNPGRTSSTVSQTRDITLRIVASPFPAAPVPTRKATSATSRNPRPPGEMSAR